MPFWLLKLLNPKFLLGAGAAIAISLFVWNYHSMQNTIDKLELVNHNQAIIIETRDLELLAQKNAFIELAVRKEESDELNENLDEIKGDVLSSSDEEDGPIAPVLRNTLDALDGLRIEREVRSTDSQS